MPYPNPNYVDSLGAVIALSVFCYNNGATYTTYNGDPSSGMQQTLLTNSDKQFIGSVTYIDGRKGTINCQYKLATDEAPGATNAIRTGFIVSFRSRFYVVGAVKEPIVKNDLIKWSADVTELQNPFVPLLLSALGQQKTETFASGGSHTISAAASGTRAGAVVAYSLETFATPGSAAPSGITINSSTGLITVGGSVAAGTYDVRAIVSDTITLPDGTTDTIYGFGRYTPTLT